MAKTLFFGDSHAHGYWDDNGTIRAWQDNNYAEIYARHFQKETIIYSLPGGCNRKYPVWLKAMLNRYNDIDELFVQSGYWNRYLIGASRMLNIGDDIKIDHFLDEDCPKDDLIHRYTDHRIQGDYLEIVEQIRPDQYTDFKGIQYHDFTQKSDWPPFHEKYTYTKLWHELTTHLQYREYCLDLLAIDTMCKEHEINWYLWTMKSDCFVPNDLNMYTDLSVHRAPISAIDYLENKYVKTKAYMIDVEHYDTPIHEKIAKEYLPFVKKHLTKT